MKKGTRKMIIFGIPSCLGGNIHGCEKGPDAIRKYLFPMLKKHKITYKDLGDVKVPTHCRIKDPRQKCLPEIRQLYQNFEFFFRHHKVFSPYSFPVLLGGDHSVNFPFIKHSAQKKPIGLIWFDAHGDFNTPRISPSGNIHGMVLSALTGRGLHKAFSLKETKLKEKNICLFGVRDLDPQEKKLLEHTKIKIFTMRHIKKVGLKKALQQAAKIASSGTRGFHLSFDLDCVDPKLAPGVGTPAKDGFTRKDLGTIANFIKKQPLLSMDIVELYPSRDKSNKTARLAAQFITKFIS